MGIRTRQTVAVTATTTTTRRAWPGKRTPGQGGAGVAHPGPGKRTRAQALPRPKLRPTNE